MVNHLIINIEVFTLIPPFPWFMIFFMYFEVFKLDQTTYRIHTIGERVEAVEGPMISMCSYLYSLGFKLAQIESALVDMVRKDKDSAHFNELGIFMYSFNMVDKYGKRA